MNCDHMECRAIAGSEKRKVWREKRKVMEIEGATANTSFFRKILVRLIPKVGAIINAGLRSTRIYQRGLRNALDVQVRQFDVFLPKLPPAFEGYSILHLSDLHVDALEEIVDVAAELVSGQLFDLCIITGDFTAERNSNLGHIQRTLQRLLAKIQIRDGCLSVLGNHDEHGVADALEQINIRMLINEDFHISRGGEKISFIGLDDVHRFHTQAANDILAHYPTAECRIALVHSAEAAYMASKEGVSLYLCGHTHGGQICFPGGRPIVTVLPMPLQFAVGWWQVGDLLGYTSCGAGVSPSLPIRFNCRGEVTIHTLRQNRAISWQQKSNQVPADERG